MIYIFGGNGFVGSAFARYCLHHKLNFQIITRENYPIFSGTHCDIFINAAGNSKMYLAKNNPLEDLRKNVLETRKSIIDFPTNNYIYISSCDVYPDFSKPEMTNEKTTIDIAHQRPYGFHKYLGEQCVQQAAKNWLILRAGGLIGLNLVKNPIFDLLHKQPLWLDPCSEMQFINTDDFATIVFELIQKKLSQTIFNVCGEGFIKLNDIIEKFSLSLKVHENSPIVKYNVSIDKLKEIISVPETRKTVFDYFNSM
jgi:nucleoside-diphosphate-sugar epimerase